VLIITEFCWTVYSYIQRYTNHTFFYKLQHIMLDLLQCIFTFSNWQSHCFIQFFRAD